MPVPNYQPQPGKPTATLGMRKGYPGSFTKLLSSITTHIASPPGSGSGNAAACELPLGQPFMVYDPEADVDEARRSTLQCVYVEPLLAGKLRPHQRDGVAFMFNCLAGLRKGGFTGAILMDGVGGIMCCTNHGVFSVEVLGCAGCLGVHASLKGSAMAGVHLLVERRYGPWQNLPNHLRPVHADVHR
jgi:hypothetical protein